MFICDCHCDTLTELYKKGTSLYDNDQHFDIKRQIELGGGLQFCAIFVPTHEFRYYGGLRYTLSLLDKYKQELKALQEKGIDVLPVLTKADAPTCSTTKQQLCWLSKKAALSTAVWKLCACSMSLACAL